MKDEERAEQKAEKYVYEKLRLLDKNGEQFRYAKKVWLNGYHECQKEHEWHDLREDSNDLPKRDIRFSTHISIPVLTQTSGFAFYQFDDKKWYFQGKEIDVIAWCEIPTFDKE